MKKIGLITIWMCVFAGAIQADDCRKNDGTSNNGTLTDTSMLPACDENIVTVKSAVEQESMQGVMQQKVKDAKGAQEIDNLAKKQRVVE